MAKTPAERKAEERKRRTEEGQILVQVWMPSKLHANKVKEFARKLSRPSDRNPN